MERSGADMRKEDTQEYLSDEALEALIRETEEGPMIKAPEYLEENINTEEFKNGFILDGFPRTIIQARKLADICSMFNFKIDAVINLDIPEDVLVKRLSGRRTCADCGKSYHIVYNPPKKEGVCDACGGELTQRSDESEEAVQVRIDTYNKQTKLLGRGS